MNPTLSDFRIVNPVTRSFSAAEARFAWSSIRFNNLSAAELGYPEYVRLLINKNGKSLGIQAANETDEFAIPFLRGRTAEDLTGKKKWITITNRTLLNILREKLGWDDRKTQRRFYGFPWPEEHAIYFDLTHAAPPRTRTPQFSSDQLLESYALATEGVYLPVPVSPFSYHSQEPYCPVPESKIIEAVYQQVG